MGDFTLPSGFRCAGMPVGIKASGLPDLGLLFSGLPADWAAVFTQNALKAHCVDQGSALLATGQPLQALLVNSGNANCANGPAAPAYTQAALSELTNLLKIPAEAALTASTGIIGQAMPSQKVLDALPELVSRLEAGTAQDFAQAIMTTDKFSKLSRRQLSGASMLGWAKGAGMIHPNMATMLCFIVTDLVAPANLQALLQSAVDKSFNAISVDGDTSTNDMVILLANGASGQEIAEEDFQAVLDTLCLELAEMIVLDGEGAERIFAITVTGANSQLEAKAIARGISRSLLVKTAVSGGDPNWGRILAAAGQYGPLDFACAKLSVAGILVLDCGQTASSIELARLSQIMKASERLELCLDLGLGGTGSFTAYGCDLNEAYVRFNAHYST